MESLVLVDDVAGAVVELVVGDFVLVWSVGEAEAVSVGDAGGVTAAAEVPESVVVDGVVVAVGVASLGAASGTTLVVELLESPAT